MTTCPPTNDNLNSGGEFAITMGTSSNNFVVATSSTDCFTPTLATMTTSSGNKRNKRSKDANSMLIIIIITYIFIIT